MFSLPLWFQPKPSSSETEKNKKGWQPLSAFLFPVPELTKGKGRSSFSQQNCTCSEGLKPFFPVAFISILKTRDDSHRFSIALPSQTLGGVPSVCFCVNHYFQDVNNN